MTPSPGDIAGVTNVTDVEHFNYSEDYDYYALLIGAVIAVVSENMTQLLNLSVDQGKRLTWSSSAGNVTISLEHIDQALLDEIKGLVFVLLKNEDEKLPHLLKVFSEEGTELAEITTPKDFQFYYLTKHPVLGTAIVGVTNNAIDGWQDWHFGYDAKKKALFRHSPSY